MSGEDELVTQDNMKSMSRYRVLGLSAALLFFLSEPSFAKTEKVYVGSGGDNFSPKTITIEPGDKIEWEWDASFHSTTSGTPGNPSGMWDSGVHRTGYKYTYEFNNAGSFPYYCSVHGGCCGGGGGCCDAAVAIEPKSVARRAIRFTCVHLFLSSGFGGRDATTPDSAPLQPLFQR